jgi:hypothetical protein
MRRLRTFLLDELLLAQATPGFVLCVGWAVMYEIYHEDGSFYTTLMQEILSGDGLFPYFLISAVLMAFPVGMVMDTVREILIERWLTLPRRGAAAAPEAFPFKALLPRRLPLERFEDRYALYRHARVALLIPAKASGNMAVVLVILLVWFVVKIVRMSGWHVYSLAFIIGTPAIGTGIVATLAVRYASGLAEYRRLLQEATAAAGADAPIAPTGGTPPLPS